MEVQSAADDFDVVAAASMIKSVQVAKPADMTEVDQQQRHTSMSSSSSSTTTTGAGSEVSEFDEDLVDFLGRAIEAVAKDGDSKSKGHVKDDDVFVGLQRVPQISIRAYLKRMLKYIDGPGLGSNSWESLSLGARSVVFALIYIDRIVAKTKLQVNSFRMHRLIATGMLVALKMNEDDVLDMNYFSLLAGIPIGQLSTLEKVFLTKIEYDTFVTEAEFSSRVRMFERLSQRKSSRKPRQ